MTTLWQKNENLKKTFSKTRRPRGLIFGISHNLNNLYEDCSDNTPGVKTCDICDLDLKERDLVYARDTSSH